MLWEGGGGGQSVTRAVLSNAALSNVYIWLFTLRFRFGQMVEALHFVHESHVIHRDLKVGTS